MKLRLLLLGASLVSLKAQQPTSASPTPSNESWLTGSLDAGYRWVSPVGGSFDTYRSFVNLGSGPKLLGSEFTVTDSAHRAFDRIDVRAYSWGDDPYSSFYLNAKKAKWYELKADYRNIAYFDFLPSYADPLLARGIVLNEQAFDTHRRFASVAIELLPENWFRPFFAYDRDSSSGTGSTTFVSDANEYPVPNRLRDLTNLYRGGIRFEFRRLHATIEGGGTTFNDDEILFQNTGGTNYGNNNATVFGNTLELTNLLGAYGVRGTGMNTKAVFSANPLSWLDLYGTFSYSEPSTSLKFQESAAGNLYLQSQVMFYSAAEYLIASGAKLPHTSASFGAEVRPQARIRITESWLTDRQHDSSSANSNQIYFSPAAASQIRSALDALLVANYNQQETNVIFDLSRRLTLRGGYRYVWGDAINAVYPAAGIAGPEQGKLRRNVGLGSVTFHASQKLTVSADAEGAASSSVYFRTSLYDYQKVRAQARYQAAGSLQLSADFTSLNNQNPAPGIRYDYLALQESASLLWAPAGARIARFEGSYTRSTIRSNIRYLVPETLTPELSFYRDNAHLVTALWTFNFRGNRAGPLQFSAGGSCFISSGSRPTTYYQPLVKVAVPISKNAAWFADWRYYGYGELFYLYEGFRAHTVTTGLRFSL